MKVLFMKISVYREILIERSALFELKEYLHLTFKTAKNLCPNLQKPSLPQRFLATRMMLVRRPSLVLPMLDNNKC